jgi:protein TonB
MSRIDLISNEWNAMVFEGRNLEYGAYQLRKNTGRRNIISILVLAAIAIALQIGLSLKNMTANRSAGRTAMTSVYDVSLLPKPKKDVKVDRKNIEIIPEKVIDKPRNSLKFTPPRIMKDDLVKEEDMLRTQDDVMKSNAAIGSFDVTGGDDKVGEIVKSHDAITQTAPKIEETNEPLTIVEQMPAFPGGNTALMQYLVKNVKYPIIAIETGISGRVVISFVVERDGSISNVKVMKSVDASLDKEAMRVVSSMPKWIPGRQNGNTVRVRYQVPVSFRLQ